MHQTTTRNPIHLVHRENGIVQTYKSFESLVHNWPLIRRLDIGTNFKIELNRGDWVRGNWEDFLRGIVPARYHDYVLRDSFGDVVDPADVRRAHYNLDPYIPRYRRFSGRKRRHYRFHRRFRTFQERKWAQAWDDEEDAPKVRARRNAKNLPNPWDDYPRHDWRIRNWKRYRRYQWK